MARTTEAAVELLLDRDDDINLAPFLEVANNMVTRCCVPADSADTAYVAADLELIERWLSAHFYSILDPQRASEGVRGISQSLQNRVDLGLNQTRYGQMAMLIDIEGGLAAADAAVKAGGKTVVGITWLGSEDQTDDEDEEE